MFRTLRVEEKQMATSGTNAGLGGGVTIASLETGKPANFIMPDCPTYSGLFEHFGTNYMEQVWVKGRGGWLRRK